MNHTIINIHSGAGGEDSEDFSGILINMYFNWANAAGLSAMMADLSMTIDGDHRKELIGQAGVHRLVRLSPFDETHRRHTSFCEVRISGMIAPFGENRNVISYVLHPHKQAINHVTGMQTEAVEEVLKGHIELLRGPVN